MKNKRNLIQEIRRINNINLGKEVITEQEAPILDLISLLVQRGSRDVKTQNLITQLGAATSQGKQISLLNQLRKSSDTLISNLVKSIDNDLTTALVEIIPRISRNKSVQDKIVSDIEAGVSMQETLNNISVFFKETYDSYVDDLLLRAFQNSLKKTYDEISASITPPKPQPPAPPKPQPPIPSPTDSISVIRNFFRDLLSKKPEYQTRLKNFQVSASDKINRIKELVEELAKPGLEGSRIREIGKEIRKIMLKLSQEDKEIMSQIQLEIDNGVNNTRGAENQQWRLLQKAFSDVEKGGADFGFIEKVSSPASEVWTVIREGIKYGLAADRNWTLKIAKVVSELFPRVSKAVDFLREVQGVDWKELELVKSPFGTGMNILVTSTFPGSMRGIPLGAPRQEIVRVGNVIKSKKDLPSGYQAIYDLQKNSKTKAWASLAIEKMVKVLKYQIIFGVLGAIKSWILYLYQSDPEVQKQFSGCIQQIGDAMEKGDISLNETPNPEKIPSCLVDILTGDQEIYNFPGSSYLYTFTKGFLGRESYTREELVQALLIRAYLQRGAASDEYASLFYGYFVRPVIEPLTRLTIEEAGLNFLLGYAPSFAYEIATEWVPEAAWREVTGGDSSFNDRLEEIANQAESASDELQDATGISIPPINTTVPTEEPVDLTTDDDLPPPPPGG